MFFFNFVSLSAALWAFFLSFTYPVDFCVVLQMKTKILPKSFLIEEKCRFLSNFSRQTAEVELPGELLLPKHSHYQVYIQRFMPRVKIVQKHNSSARRLYIRGHNGKIYPYLVVNDSGAGANRVLESGNSLIFLSSKKVWPTQGGRRGFCSS